MQFVKIHYGPCDSFYTVSHKPQKLRGLRGERINVRNYDNNNESLIYLTMMSYFKNNIYIKRTFKNIVQETLSLSGLAFDVANQDCGGLTNKAIAITFITRDKRVEIILPTFQ